MDTPLNFAPFARFVPFALELFSAPSALLRVPGPRLGRAMLAMALTALFVAPTAAIAQEQPEQPPAETQADRARNLHRLMQAAFAREDYAAAESHLRELLGLEPDNFVVHYNFACALARQEEAEEAARWLVRAVEHGFDNLPHLEADPDLENIRGRPEYRYLIDNWDDILAQRRDANLQAIKRIYGEDYLYLRDERMRISIASSFDRTTTNQILAELNMLYDWALEHVFTDLAGEAEDPWVVVILPTQADFARWVARTYGAAGVTDARQIGGSYNHDSKRLIAMDLGGTLRHEFFHILHWRSMTRLRHHHPIWIQEGLCSLIEDYDPHDPDQGALKPLDGPRAAARGAAIHPVPSWRTNIVHRLARAGRLPPLADLAAMDPHRFSNVNPLANYGQARTFFLYLHERGLLGAWYKRYTDTYANDRSGIQAALDATGLEDAAALDADYRAWARNLPEVPEQHRPPPVQLGLDTARSSGDGMIVTAIGSRDARRAGIRPGDVITSLDGRPTRDINELLRHLGRYEPGQEVELGIRRRDEHETVRVVLQRR